ncbi:ficolin-1-A-like isoform X1 [Rhinoderma darwinii]|uniref:ficolin-1-A-like isoform X1 n=1 Tax=Rhinoderma darwinii TaxID=43563 RepID=UPI003F666967
MIPSPQDILGLLLGTILICSQAEDTCPDVKLIGVGESDKLAVLRGCQGIPGFPGLQGSAGPQGIQGDKGAPGQMGKLGPTGEKGDKGALGQTGPQGQTGEKGDKGALGQIGPLGPTGGKGDNGAPGQTGPLGPTGVKGDKGSVGPMGPRGQSGEKGSQGVKGDSHRLAYGVAKDCKELRDQGMIFSGWYTIHPDGMKPLMVLCDMTTDGGGWIVFQRRVDGSVDFYQDWKTYKRGFGSQLSEFWLGNENIHRLTSKGRFQLRVDLEDFDNNQTYSSYKNFQIDGETNSYTLHFGQFIEGTAGDSLTYHKKAKFSTHDKENDQSTDNHCAEKYNGAWWYSNCYQSNLNGLYLRGKISTEKLKYSGNSWETFRGHTYSLKMSEMKFRPE